MAFDCFPTHDNVDMLLQVATHHTAKQEVKVQDIAGEVIFQDREFFVLSGDRSVWSPYEAGHRKLQRGAEVVVVGHVLGCLGLEQRTAAGEATFGRFSEVLPLAV